MTFITFDRYKIDMAEKACERLLSQFENSTNGIQRFLGAFVEQTQSLNDVELTVLMDRALENAIGVQLDIIGRIVGIDRPLVVGNDILWFQPDSQNEVQHWDSSSTWWVSTAPSGTDFVPVTDSIYKRFIVGKIFKNQVSGATVPELISFIRIVFSVWSSVLPGSEIASVIVHVEDTIDPILIPALTAVRSDSNVQNEYFLPIASGVKLEAVNLVPAP